MNQVWKFELNLDDSPIEMPCVAQPLSVGFQGDTLFLWALVDPNEKMEKRKFITRGTGHNILEDNPYFIGTAPYNTLVFHVFEVLNHKEE
jgi:hypothetical protein